MHTLSFYLSLMVLSVISFPRVAASQMLETESAYPLRAGWLEVSDNYEYQTSNEGSETAIPLALEYGITNNLELMIEPVVYTAIRPHQGAQATGLGDMEVTLTYVFQKEHAFWPALAVAAEMKIATARNSLIGTRANDYTGYFIASKRLGAFDVHANFAYTFVGSPAGTQLSNLVNYAAAVVYHPADRYEIFAEALGNSLISAEGSGEGDGAEDTIIPEAAGGERVGTLGLARFFGSDLKVFMSLSYDNTNAVLLRPGLSYYFH